MKVKTDFYYDRLYWDAVDEMLNNNNETEGCQLLCENHGSLIAICAPNCAYIQVGSWTLQYEVL